jgi:acetyl-CoA carboxylase biotin carboxylase subunit
MNLRRDQRFSSLTSPAHACDHSHCFPGYIVPPFYDSLLAKLIVRGAGRAQALERMATALREFRIEELPTNLEFLALLIEQPEVRRGEIATRWVEGNMERFCLTEDK